MTIENINIKPGLIRDVLIKNDFRFINMGILDGLLGLSLYHYYYYLYTNDETYLKDVTIYLEKSIESIGEGYKGTNIINDIIELGDYLFFLYQENVFDKEDVNTFLVDSDEIIKDFLIEEIKKKNLDPMFGVIRVGYYFLNRLEVLDVNTELLDVLKAIDNQAIKLDNLAYWEFTLKSPQEPVVELGTTHGVAGIINFLLKAYSKNIDYKNLKSLIIKGLNFLSEFNEKKGINWFRLEAAVNKKLSYQDLAYGDLGIGYTFLNAGQILQNDRFRSTGIEIIENAANFRDNGKNYIKDASLFYGASGLFALMQKLNKQLNSPILKESETYWKEIALKMDDKKSVWAGYLSHYNAQHDYTHLSFLEGICGIGITLMTQKSGLEHDYLRFLNFY